jgi:hypothetical protein
MRQYLPDFDFGSFRHADSFARISDAVRLNVLAVYGGIWMDASIICNRSLKWVNQSLQGKEFLGYYMKGFTKISEYPVIESWFFACIPKSQFVVKWRDTFININKYESPQEYIDSLHVDPQGIPPTLQTYLAIHMAAQYVLQKLKYPISNMTLLKCEEGPFLYLVENNWDSEKAVKNNGK